MGASRRQGAVLVEFALVAPVFFLVILAMFEFSWLNVVRHTADNAAYEAARIAMVPGATSQEAIDEANRILRIVGTRSARVSVDPPVLGPATRQVRVSVDVPLERNSLVAPKFLRGRNLHSESTLRTERAENR